MTTYRLSREALAKLKSKRAEINEALRGVGGNVIPHPALVSRLRQEYRDLLVSLFSEARRGE